MRGVSHCHTVIAARCRDDTGRRHGPKQQIGEGAARLERAAVLEQLQLAVNRPRLEPEIREVHCNDGCTSNVWADELVRRRDLLALYRRGVHAFVAIPYAWTLRVAGEARPRRAMEKNE